MAISEDLVSVMQTYTDETKQQIEDGMRQIGRETVQRLRTTSPVKTGKYAKGWKAEIKTTDDGVQLTVRETGRMASLTHLLENGHKIYKHKDRRTRAFPHIQPAEEWAEEQAEKLIQKAVSG